MNVATEKQVQIIRPLAEYSANARIQRVAAYCRVSTDSDDQVNSFLNQVRYYTDFIRTSDKMELVDIYADEGITGTSLDKRDDFKRMLNDARLGKIDRIYVKSVQRFARNSLECLESVRKLADYGASVYFENDRIDTRTMSSEMILYIKSAFAQNDSLNFSKRMAMSYRMKMEEGNFITYCAPYGYRLENGSLVIIEDEAVIVVRIFDMYLAGKGMGQIAAILNREGVPSRESKWNKAHIRYILSNEKYIGDALLQKTFTPEILPLRNRKNKGEKDKFYVTNSHPAIISREVFEAAQQRLKEREQYAPKKPKQQYLLTRMIYCNECGWAYKRRVQNGITYWVCSRKGNTLYKRLTTRMKFIFGKRVRVGKQYADYRPIEGITLSKGKCTPLYYDSSAKRLLVQVQERPYSIIFLQGDLAVFRNVIYCDCGGSAIHFDSTPRRAIEALLAQKDGEVQRSEEEVLCALRGRYCKYPVSLLRSLARMYLDGGDTIVTKKSRGYSKGESQNGAY